MGRPTDPWRHRVARGALLVALALLLVGGPVPTSALRAAGPATPIDRTPSTVGGGARTMESPSPLLRGSSWTNRTAALGANAPSARQLAMSAYDAEDGYVLLFGGQPNRGGGPLRDTWVFENNVWTNLTASLTTSPPARFGGMMTYDPFAREVLLFGGLRVGGYLGDTWAFSGGAWSQLFPSHTPGALALGAMSFDAADGYVLLFGGVNSTGSVGNRTWSFANGDWSDLTPTVTGAPPPTQAAAATYDPSVGAVLLYGGSGATATRNTTWTYRDLKWTNRTGTTGGNPGPRSYAMLAYDAADGFDLLFGGLKGLSALNDSWSYTLGRWSLLSTPAAPPGRFEGTLVYTAGPLPANAEVLLAGGRVTLLTNLSALGDTWTFKVPLSGTLNLSVLRIDRGQATQVTVAAAGGIAPYSVDWPALPAGCVGPSAPGTFDCSPSIPGEAVFVAEITDSVNATVLAPGVNVTVAADPTASTSATPGQGRAPLSVDFNATVTGGTAPFTYTWEFGDGSLGTLANTSHSYATPGTYFANLSVRDAAGLTAEATPVPVRVGGPLVATAEASASIGTAPLTLAFTTHVSGGLSPFSYNWSFGAGEGFSLDPDPEYTYSTSGNFTVTLSVTDALGETSGSSVSLRVFAPVDADFTAAFPGGLNCSTGHPVATLALAADPSGGLGPYNETWHAAGVTAYGPQTNLTVVGGVGLTVELTLTDSRGTYANATEGVTAPASLCPATSGGTGPATFSILWAILGLLAVIVVIEAVVLLTGRRNREESAPKSPPPPSPG